MVDEVVEPTAPEAEATPETVETPPKPVERDKVQERIGELTYKLRQAEADNQRLKAEREAKPPPEAPTKPTLEQSGYDEAKHQEAMDAYYRAMVKHEAKEEARNLLKEEREAEKARSRDEAFGARLKKMSKEDRDAAMSAMVPDSKDIAGLIMESDVGELVLLHLAKNPELAESIARLPSYQQAKEIGRIEASLSKADAPEPKQVSKAPTPAPKLEAVEPTTKIDVTSPESDKLSDEEWARRRNKQASKRG